jgi:carboxylesterase type B
MNKNVNHCKLCILGAFHGSELPLIFGWPFFEENPLALNHSQANLLIPTNYTEFDKEFSTFMMELWTNFAKFG